MIATDTATADQVVAPEGGRRRRRYRILVAATTLVTSLLAITGLAVLALVNNLGRADGVFDNLPARPAEQSPESLDVLLVSTDMVTVVHVDGDRNRASMIWLPPQTEPTVAAVEQLTGLRIDHYAQLDWSVLAELETTAGPFWPPYEHSDDPMENAQRQEDYVRMVISGTLHQEMAKNPLLLYRFLSTLTAHLTVDREWTVGDLARLAVSVRGMRSWDIQYVTAPTEASAAEFWDAVRHDRTGNLGSLAPVSGAVPGTP